MLCLMLGTTSCITNRSLSLMQTDSRLPQYEKAEYRYYRLMPNDQLALRVLTLNEEAGEMYNSNNSNTYNWKHYRPKVMTN